MEILKQYASVAEDIMCWINSEGNLLKPILVPGIFCKHIHLQKVSLLMSLSFEGVLQLHQKMVWLESCMVDRNGKYPKAVEIIWRTFHMELLHRLEDQHTCRDGYSFLALKLMQKLVNRLYRKPANHQSSVELSDRDRDIVIYIWGAIC